MTTSEEAFPTGDFQPLQTLLYGLSLPERSMRSLAAVLGGLVHEGAERCIPLAFRSSRSYQTFVHQSLEILMHDVGGVQKATTAAVSEAEQTIAQKAVAGLLDVAGAATLHYSPLTVLAVFSDVAYGSNVYLKQLAEELERDGIISDRSTIHHASDLLTAVQRTGDRTSVAVESPPLDYAGLKSTIQEIRDSVNEVDPTSLLPHAEIAQIWSDIEDISSKSSLGLWQIGSAITLHSLNRADTARKISLTSVRLAGGLFDQHVVDHYRNAIGEIHRDGVLVVVARASEPYLDAVWHNFDDSRETWTEGLLGGRYIKQISDNTVGRWTAWWKGTNSEGDLAEDQPSSSDST